MKEVALTLNDEKIIPEMYRAIHYINHRPLFNAPAAGSGPPVCVEILEGKLNM